MTLRKLMVPILIAAAFVALPALAQKADTDRNQSGKKAAGARVDAPKDRKSDRRQDADSRRKEDVRADKGREEQPDEPEEDGR